MPLVRIDLRHGTSPEYRKALGDGVHRAMVEAIAIPPDDRFQVIAEHLASDLIYDPQYLGVHRSERVVFVRANHAERRTQTTTKAKTLQAHRGNTGGVSRPATARPGHQSRRNVVGKLVIRQRRSAVHGHLTCWPGSTSPSRLREFLVCPLFHLRAFRRS
jgi:4-oxalocrotonate tautomerase